MPMYNVHIYREMKLLFEGVEADTMEEAIRRVKDHPSDYANQLGDCDGNTTAAVIDESFNFDVNDDEITLVE